MLSKMPSPETKASEVALNEFFASIDKTSRDGTATFRSNRSNLEIVVLPDGGNWSVELRPKRFGGRLLRGGGAIFKIDGKNWSVIEGRFFTGHSIEVLPSGPSFELPPSFLRHWYGNWDSIHLTPTELEQVETARGTEWDNEFAQVVNATLPFRECLAHFGEGGWGPEGVSPMPLQVRVYLLADSVDNITKAIETNGVSAAKNIDEKKASLSKFPEEGGWERRLLAYYLFFGDYGGTALVDFRYKAFGRKTVVFAFMYVDDHMRQQKDISSILASVRKGKMGK